MQFEQMIVWVSDGMSVMASQITANSTMYSTVCLG